ncbi:ABC transporter [Alkalihalobacillus alcalophilus ATCC 27647 = CGMCC 1.3604]|uniref:ABC transporter n=1 Tax=Alkalihalobacillus alcalophilus ATCC 27647 = CGMCC 1.3604 TaxID=1218173 RepID=J8Q9S2_ALKAL|nr:ABC transporter ATP-binding protein [Alkalihalobacillus alcalophilus]AFV25782.1 polysaccharide export transporter [Alkalihalobacillus alcalophilus ATCC 27647 = CGMCC 1.3604]KGA96900.1 teichoic acid ABC transporter ATP-binding protein [Alkalihalobacillus alcalophilus ATCC 27647 = CGMCC 1.3604]MED1562631.1 ABC transporter ATP-binding protein [Alkalihalobacillus alcalophilus]THG88609.1 ABC transporter [Alkalihalobacillus alcalophilus ATCC 27647 = CGMCC 1.3604]
MENPVVEVKNIGKLYPKHATKILSLKDRYLKKERNFAGQWSVKDVSFNIQKGDSVAILGDNGSGKSTLLKLILGVTAPTTGSIVVNGKIGGLIELGAGFHKELSGRENIYMNGVVLGLKEKEIDQLIDQIIEFAELKDHIDKPIKQYSSGMKVRLGFSIAIHVESDIILLDEVLAVGDKRFKKKALAAVKSYLKGKTIIFVSHSTHQVKQICQKAIVLKDGQLVYEGDTESAIEFYENQTIEIE